MNASSDYSPPNSRAIRTRQNDLEALRLLIAQRRLYRRAKGVLAARWTGMLIIGIAAPLASVLHPPLAVASGAVAGTWIFLGRTFLLRAQSSLTVKAAAVQEQFDHYVFQMPHSGDRSTLPSLEDIAAVAGSDDEIQIVAGRENLLDWYPVDDKYDDGAVTIAICQRANASYSDRLIRTTAITWTGATALWIIFLVVLSLVLRTSLSSFLLGVLLPVLPAFLDVFDYVTSVWRSAKKRRDLVQSIEGRLTNSEDSVDGQSLLVWQERIFDLRQSSPDVPDFLYRIRRNVNERAMHSVARRLRRRVKGDD